MTKPSLTWEMVIEQWPRIAADLRGEYGWDVYDQSQRRATSWAAARSMIGGLMNADTRLSRWFESKYGKKPKTPTARRR